MYKWSHQGAKSCGINHVSLTQILWWSRQGGEFGFQAFSVW